MSTNKLTTFTLFALTGVALAACGGGGGGDAPASQPAPAPTPAPGGQAPPAPPPAPGGQVPPPAAAVTRPLNVTLKQGEYLEFAWQTEQRNFAQPSTTTLESAAGRFTLTLGASVLIQGQVAFPLTRTGNAGTFAPRWTHFAMAADGSLLGSTDGAGLKKIYDAASSTWAGGGMFTDFGQSAVTVSVGSFDGEYNDAPAIVTGRTADDTRCEQILGLTLCDDDATRFSEREYYKEGIGPIGFAQHIYHESDSGGFFTSTTIDKTVELIESSLAATDGTVFVRPPWDEMAPMLTPRSGHMAVVVGDRIWVLGGVDANNKPLASTEFYLPAGDRWVQGFPLPVPIVDGSAVVAGTQTVVMKDNDEIFVSGPIGTWQARTPANTSPVPVDATYHQHPTFGDMLVGATRVSQADPFIHIAAYDVSENRWYFGGTSQPWRELLRASVEGVGSSVFVIGGFGTSGSILDKRRALDTVMEFDMTTERWLRTGAGALNVARDNPATVVLNDTIYVFGGNDVSCNLLDCTPGPALRDVESYDPVNRSSSDLPPMLYPRSAAEAVTLDGFIYVIGGRSNGVSLATVERLTTR
jgi:hypothetical protein